MRRLIDAKGLRERGVNYSDTHRDRMIKAGKFPKPTTSLATAANSIGMRPK